MMHHMLTHETFWRRFAHAQISRRRALAWSAAAGAIATMPALACRGGDSASDASPRRGGTLRIGAVTPIASGLDPQIETGGGLAITPRLYGYLVSIDHRDGAMTLDHAASVEQPDDTTIIVRLKPDVRFHDAQEVPGRAVVAEDVVRSIERFRDNPLVLRKPWHTTVLDAAGSPDSTTVLVRLKRPYVSSLEELSAIDAGAILAREDVIAQRDLTQGEGAGSGPFRVGSADLAARVSAVRHDGYYGAPLPYVDAMEWHYFQTDTERTRAFTSGELDVVSPRNRGEAEELREIKGVDVTSERSLATVAVALRVDRPPFNDERLRRAVDVGLDRQAMIRDVAAGSGIICGPVNPHLGNGSWALPRAEVLEAQGSGGVIARREDATAMIEAAGQAGAEVSMQVPDVPELLDLSAVVRDQLRAMGLRASVEVRSQLDHYAALRRGEFAFSLLALEPYETPDAAMRWYHSGGPEGSRNPTGFDDDETDSLIEQAWAERDREARRDLLLRAQRRALSLRPMLPLFTSSGYSAAWSWVRDRQANRTGAAAQRYYGQWLSLPAAGRAPEPAD